MADIPYDWGDMTPPTDEELAILQRAYPQYVHESAMQAWRARCLKEVRDAVRKHGKIYAALPVE